MVEGAFARAFKSELQPVEVASAVQREMDDRAAIVAQGRTLVPNDFVVEVSEPDFDRLEVYADNLGMELATLARDYAKEQGYSFVGPVRMRFEGVPDLSTGMFRIRSGVIRGHTVEAGEVRQPVSDLPRPQGGQFYGRPRLVVSSSSGSLEAGSTYELQTPVTLLGRGTDCDLRMVDPGVSRHHAELRVEDDQVVLVDLGSTNGTFVNGQPTRRVVLADGMNITLGRTTMVFRQDEQPGGGYAEDGYHGGYQGGGYDNRGYQGDGYQGGGYSGGGYEPGYAPPGGYPPPGNYENGGYQGGGYEGDGYSDDGYADRRY
jgi:hypothetical protein